MERRSKMEDKKQSGFLKGLLIGIVATCLIAGFLWIGVNSDITLFDGTNFSSDKNKQEQVDSVSAQVSSKLKYLEDLIEEQYLFDYEDEDLEYLYQTKKDLFKWYVEIAYGPWNDKFQLEFFINFINEKRKYIKVVMYENKPIGMFTNYINENDEDLIDLFYIDKKYQGKGIGTQILKEQLKQDEENNVNTVLQVFKDNPAKRLYEKMGFKIYDQTEYHYKMIRKIKRGEKNDKTN